MKRRILKLAFPNIITNLTIPLIGVADLAIAGRLDQQGAIGAVVLGTTIFNFLYMNFGFLRMGTCGFASQSYGAGNLAEAGRVLIRSLIISIAIAIFILLLGSVTCNFAMDIMSGSEGVERLATTYFFYRIIGAPAVMALYSVKGWFIGMQKPSYAMWVAIIINLVNISASILFSVPLGMGVAGIGLGSAIGQWVGALVAFAILHIKYHNSVFTLNIKEDLFNLERIEKFFSVNIDIFVRTFCVVAVLTYFTIASSEFGDTVLEANALLLQLFTIFSYMTDGFSYATESLVGNYYGARQIDMLKKSIKGSVILGLWIAILFSLIYLFFSKFILSFFNPSDIVLNESMKYIYYAVLIPFVSFFAFIYDGVLVGLTQSKIMRNIMFVASLSFFVIYFSCNHFVGNNAIWIAFVVFLLIRSVFEPIFTMKYIKSNNI